MTRRSTPLIAASAALPLLLLAAAGCQTTQFTGRALPTQFRAAPGAGNQRMRLDGLAIAGGPSSAIDVADTLSVKVLTGVSDEESEPVQVQVGDDGAIELPYIGRVAVVGSEPDAVAQLITAAAVERGVYRRPHIQVEVLERATYKLTVLGAVSAPGVHEVPRSGCDVLTAIAAAGGFSEDAGTVVEVLRHSPIGLAASAPAPGKEAAGGGVQQASFDAPTLAAPSLAAPTSRTQKFDLADLTGSQVTGQRLGDRDVVVVRPKEKRVVHVSGMVNAPDQFEMTEDHDIRVLDAIAMAGGASSSVADKVLVIRQIEGREEPLVIGVSMSEAKKNGDENLLLQSGDLVTVEPTVATAVVEVLSTFFRVSLGLGGNLSLF